MQRAKTRFIALKTIYLFVVRIWQPMNCIHPAAEAGFAPTLLLDHGAGERVSPEGLPLPGFSFFLFKSLQTILKKPKLRRSNYPSAPQKIVAVQPSAHARIQTQY